MGLSLPSCSRLILRFVKMALIPHGPYLGNVGLPNKFNDARYWIPRVYPGMPGFNNAGFYHPDWPWLLKVWDDDEQDFVGEC